MNIGEQIYFDNSATSFPKDPRVIATMCDSYSRFGNPGRSGHYPALAASDAMFSCREALAKHYGATPDRVIFCPSATYALNFAIKGIIYNNLKSAGRSRKPRVVCSSLEHNSVYRPLFRLAKDNLIELKVSDVCLPGSEESDHYSHTLKNIADAITPETILAVFTHASNVCGHILPIAEISKLTKAAGVPLIVDAAQSCGYLPIDVNSDGIDALCLAAHKGLGAPFGVTAMLLGKNCPAFETLVEGGTGSLSLEGNMPDFLPDRLEPGTQNAPAIAALETALSLVDYTDRSAYALRDYIIAGLREIKGVTIYGVSMNSLPVVLFNIGKMPSEETANRLAENNVCVRGGFHCAPLAHKTLKTGGRGAVRVSLSRHNTKTEAEKFLELVKNHVNQSTKNHKIIH